MAGLAVRRGHPAAQFPTLVSFLPLQSVPMPIYGDLFASKQRIGALAIQAQRNFVSKLLVHQCTIVFGTTLTTRRHASHKKENICTSECLLNFFFVGPCSCQGCVQGLVDVK